MLERLKKIHIYLPASNKGFISSYFLMIFISILVLVSLEIKNIIHTNQMLQNLKIINQYSAYEAKVIHYFKVTEIEESEDTITLNNLSFTYKKNDSTIIVEIISPIEESFVLYLENQEIFDYDVKRYKESG